MLPSPLKDSRLAYGPDGRVLQRAAWRLVMGHVWLLGQDLDTPDIEENEVQYIPCRKVNRTHLTSNINKEN